jgi:hypothetical protein
MSRLANHIIVCCADYRDGGCCPSFCDSRRYDCEIFVLYERETVENQVRTGAEDGEVQVRSVKVSKLRNCDLLAQAFDSEQISKSHCTTWLEARFRDVLSSSSRFRF